MPVPLDPAREMLSDSQGWQLRVRVARNLARDSGWGTSVASSAVAHAVAIASLYAGSWLWFWADVGEWQVIPPQHGTSSAASAERQVLEVAATRVDENPLSDPVAMSASAIATEPEALGPREMEISPVGEVPLVVAATLDASAIQPESPALSKAMAARRAAAHEAIDTLQDDSPLIARDDRSTRPSTLAASRATIAEQSSSAKSAAPISSHGARSLPSPVFNPAPIYPPELEAARVEGLVKLRVELDTKGRVVKATVSKPSGYAAFDRAALDVIYRWRFTASTPRAPTHRTVTVPIHFGLID